MNEVEQRTMLDMARAATIKLDDTDVNLMELIAQYVIKIETCTRLAEGGLAASQAIPMIEKSIGDLERFIKDHPRTKEVLEFTLAHHYYARGYYSIKVLELGGGKKAFEDAISYYQKALAIPNLPPEFKARMQDVVDRARAIEEVTGKSGKCFIATAVYGDPFAPDVVLFRNYRDQKLRPRKYGPSVIYRNTAKVAMNQSAHQR